MAQLNAVLAFLNTGVFRKLTHHIYNPIFFSAYDGLIFVKACVMFLPSSRVLSFLLLLQFFFQE